MDVKQVTGGYIIAEYEGEGAVRRVFVSLEGVFNYMLLQFEGRCENFRSSSFGVVTINRNPSDANLSRTFVEEDTNDRSE